MEVSPFWEEMELHKLGGWLIGYLAWFTTWRVLDADQAVSAGQMLFVMGFFIAGWTLCAWFNYKGKQ